MLIRTLSDFNLDNFTLDKFTLDKMVLDKPPFGGKYIDRSIPVTVAASAYDISGNGGRKLTRLSNGWLVATAYSSATSYLYFYVSKDNGATWSQLCYSNNTFTGFAIASYGTTVYCLIGGGSSWVALLRFDATTVTNTNQNGASNPDSGQNSVGSGMSLIVNSNGHLHATWYSKNGTYPNSFNIRYSKSTDGGTTWAIPTQISVCNGAGSDVKNPCIVIKNDGNPSIVMDYVDLSTKHIYCANYNGSTWATVDVYNGGTYAQLEPCAVASPDGNIHVSWYGFVAPDVTNTHIHYTKSTDGGATWSPVERLTSVYSHARPSITADKDNKIYVVWYGLDASNPTYVQIKKIIHNGSSWGSITNITTGTTAPQYYAQTCANYTDFTDSIMIWQDNQAGAIKFRGVWNEAA